MLDGIMHVDLQEAEFAAQPGSIRRWVLGGSAPGEMPGGQLGEVPGGQSACGPVFCELFARGDHGKEVQPSWMGSWVGERVPVWVCVPTHIWG
jgi:hypothetical protein